MARAGGLREDERDALKSQDELWHEGQCLPSDWETGWERGLVLGIQSGCWWGSEVGHNVLLFWGPNGREQCFGTAGTDKVGAILKGSEDS